METIDTITLREYLTLRDELWMLDDKRIFFLACIPVETGATPGEIVNIRRDSFRAHLSMDNKRFYSTFLGRGAKRVIVGKNKDGTLKVRARSRDIVFTSDMTRKIMNFLGDTTGYPTEYFIPKRKISGSPRLRGVDAPFTRMGIMRILKNSPVRIPYNLHKCQGNVPGGRHLFKEFMETQLSMKQMLPDGVLRKMMGHKPKDAHELYNPKVNVELAFRMVEATFVEGGL